MSFQNPIRVLHIRNIGNQPLTLGVAPVDEEELIGTDITPFDGSSFYDGYGIVRILPGRSFDIEEYRVNLGQVENWVKSGLCHARSYDHIQVAPDDLQSPDNLSLTPANTQTVEIMWDAPSSGPQPTSYRIEKEAVSDGIDWKTLGIISSTEYIDYNLKPGADYNYRIVSLLNLGQSNESNPSDTVLITMPVLNPPDNFSGVAINTEQINLSWDAPSTGLTPTSYLLERKYPFIDAWEEILETTSTAYADTGLVSGITYNYRVTSHYTTEYGTDISDSVVTEVATPLLGPPDGLLAVSDTASTVDLTWAHPILGATPTGYLIERQELPGGSWVIVTTVAITSHTDSGLLSDTSYNYRVTSLLGADEGGSDTTSVTTQFILPPTGIIVSAGITTADLSWTAPATGLTPTNYRVEALIGTSWASVDTIDASTSYTYTGLTGNTAYTFRVRSLRSPDVSDPSEEVVDTTSFLDSPTDLVASAISNSEINLYWTAPAAGLTPTSYRIEREPPAGGWSFITDTFGTTYTDSGLTSATTYSYRVSSIYTPEVSSPSNVAFDTTDSSPSDIMPSSTLKAWYDAANSDNITLNGANISQWDDLGSGIYNMTQGVDSRQPLYDLKSVNNLNAAYFDDAFTQYLTTTLYGGLGQTAFYVWAVCVPDDDTIAMTVWSTGDTASSFGYVRLYVAGDVAGDPVGISVGRNGGVTTQNSIEVNKANFFKCLSYNAPSADLDNISIQANTGPVANKAYGTYDTVNVMGIGANHGVSQSAYWSGHICEVIWANPLTLTLEQAQAVDLYLQKKWATPSFSPPSDVLGANLLAWYDASDLTTLTLDGASVLQWDDKSGNNNHVTATITSGVAPTSTAAAINDLNAIYFDGTQYLEGAAFISPSPTLHMWVVVHVTDNFSTVCSSCDADYIEYHVIQYYNGSMRYRAYDASGGGDTSSEVSSTVILNNTYIVKAQELTTERTIWVDDGAGYDSVAITVTPDNIDTFVIGARLQLSSYGDYMTGYICEIIIAEDTGLTNSQINTIDAYLAHKWQNIDSTSPSTILDSRLVGWWDVSDPATVSLSSGDIIGLADKSASGNDFDTAATAPAIDTTSYSLDMLKMVPGNVLSGTFSDIFAGDTTSVWIVCALNATDYTSYSHTLLSFYGGSVFNFQSSLGKIRVTYHTQAITSTETFNTSRPFVVSFTTDGVTANIGINGLENSGSFALTPTSINSANIWIPQASGDPTGWIGEIVTAKGAVTDTERMAVTNHLMSKWSIGPDANPDIILGTKLKAWWDPSDTDTLILEDANVVSLLDKAGTYDLSQSVIADRPTIDSHPFEHGLTMLRVDADYLECLTGAPFTDLSEEVHMWVVFQMDDTSGNDHIFCVGEIGTSTALSILGNGGAGGDPMVYSGSGGISASTPNGYLANTIHIAHAWSSAINDHRVTLDDGAEGTSTASFSGVNPLDGVRVPAGSMVSVLSMTGYIGEIIVAAGTLTTAQQDDIHNYLKNKWGTV